MHKKLFDRIVQQLLPEMDDAPARKALVESALYGAPVLSKIQWEGAARPFTIRLVRLLEEYGEVTVGRLALVALLEEVKGQVGVNQQASLDDLVRQLQMPPAQQTLTLPPTTFETGQLAIFISYARPDQAVAEKVEAFLRAAGVGVFRDTRDIREGANWDMTIEKALHDCQRMVLLLSASSMPYRKEVHREWFYFDQERKPIYPLYIQDCDLHSRLYAYNYVDARTDLQQALERLLHDLGRDFDLPEVMRGADKIGVFEGVEVEAHTLPEAIQALLKAVCDPAGSVVLSLEQATAIRDHKPVDLTEYRLGRIAEWSLPRYQLDNRFVNLTLLLDKGESDPQRWQKAENYRFNDLRDVLKKVDDPALVLLGTPGSGKSTLLRRLELDHSMERLRDEGEAVSFFIQLNGYRSRADGVLPEPRVWLNSRWAERYPQLPPLDTYLKAGRVLLLLDALNEMPHKSTAEYHQRVGLWRSFTQAVTPLGNRVVFSCRTLDYSALLSSPELRVPQVEVQPMDAKQVRAFLRVYSPAHEHLIWQELDGAPQFSLFQTPYFLKLLCEQVDATRVVPKGRAALFTSFIRQTLYRELHSDLFQSDILLNEQDNQKLSLGKWRDPFDLPEHGILISKLSFLAFTMQKKGLETEGAQVRIDYDDACALLQHDRYEDILRAGVALSVLDEDITRYEIAFFHQLLQEFFAARRLAHDPNPALVQVAWAVDQVHSTLEETLAGLADGAALPLLPQTGWEETTLTAAPMAADPEKFIRDLMSHNLPLAGRCAASSEVTLSETLKADIRQALIQRTHDMQADVRARIAAGEALGRLGDPRFKLQTGLLGDYLLPPLVDIPAGAYPMGTDDSSFDDEKPAHAVTLAAYKIGQFPVTNAEYALFMVAGGYEGEQWWDTEEAKAWRRGEGSTEGQKASWRVMRKSLQEDWVDDEIRGLVQENRMASEEAKSYIVMRNWTDEQFEQWLDEEFPLCEVYRQPELWNDSQFNNPAQPVVGLTWFEARAYCKWLSLQTGQVFELPTEAQFEAAARGKQGRLFPYGSTFESSRCNTFESHLRRSTPVGVFANATPEGAFDLSGNVYTWTLSIYDQERYPYPYSAKDGREDIHKKDTRRVVRGGSWGHDRDIARSVSGYYFHPAVRHFDIGFRVVCLVPSSS